MTFADSISTCFRKFTDINGRASRSEYWWFYLFSTILITLVLMVVLIFFPLIGYCINDVVGMFVLPIIGLVLLVLLCFLLMFAVTIRRLHDTGHSGLWYLIIFVPLIGPFWLLILLMTGNNDENQYGLPEY